MMHVQIIHEQKNESWLESVGIEPEIVQIIEDGIVDELHIIAACCFYESTQLYLTNGHILTIDEEYLIFLSRWTQLTQNTISKAI